MKAISRRLRKLEDRFIPAAETEANRRLRQRLEAARRRLGDSPAAAIRPLGYPTEGRQIRESLGINTIVEILHAGRQRARLDALREAEIASDNGN